MHAYKRMLYFYEQESLLFFCYLGFFTNYNTKTMPQGAVVYLGLNDCKDFTYWCEFLCSPGLTEVNWPPESPASLGLPPIVSQPLA